MSEKSLCEWNLHKQPGKFSLWVSYWLPATNRRKNLSGLVQNLLNPVLINICLNQAYACTLYNKCFPEWRYALHLLHDGSILIAVFILFPTDTRRGNCFLEYRRGRCSSPLAMQISKSMCCCMDDDAVKAWGPRCELCPRKGEALYSQLCTDTLSKWLQ